MTRRRRRLANLVTLARDLEVALNGKLDRILDRKLAHDLAVELRWAIERSRVIDDLRLFEVYERVRELESAVESHCLGKAGFGPLSAGARSIRVDLDTIARTTVPSGPAEKLVALAVAALPLPHQARFSEEFRAELADLPRGRRWGHALGLVCRSPGLRRALVGEPAPRSARR
ncbi:hypothetical protein ACIGNX_18480 [Actinosynnema sp. NPDC053489]|uniref:hypothetical protein n=1 Tax=Actinosynnema sp. NPDC053489 TaxID=3363916 RepID=UPI0037CC2F37